MPNFVSTIWYERPQSDYVFKGDVSDLVDILSRQQVIEYRTIPRKLKTPDEETTKQTSKKELNVPTPTTSKGCSSSDPQSSKAM